MAATLALACGGGPGGDAVRPPDILLLSVDTLRPDHLQIYGYGRSTSPTLTRAFRDAAVFERAYATAASTPPSVVSLLSGRLPQGHGVRLFYQLVPEGTRLLPELLPDAYRTAAFVSNLVLTDEALGIATRFDHYDDHVDESAAEHLFERRAGRTTDAALAWLAEAHDPQRPLFLWVHYIDPHGPYRPPAEAPIRFRHEGRVPLEPERVNPYQILPGSDDALDYVDRYDEEIAYVDAAIGRLLEGASRHLDLDRAVLAFTADHGESMLEHERWFTHGYQVYEEIVRVPLLLRGPGIAPGRRTNPVSLVDLAPTLLRLAGAEPPPDLPGRDLLAPGADATRDVFVEAFDRRHLWQAVIHGTEKWVARLEPRADRPNGVRHYDLAADPEERAAAPWPARDGGPAGRLLARIHSDEHPGTRIPEGQAGRRLAHPKVDPRADARALEGLRALGYVE